MYDRPYRKFLAWQKAHNLCLQVYKLTKTFPQDERFALTQQLRRSSYSVPTNIAEGNARRSHKEKRHFLCIALGSLDEVHYQCELAHDLGYMNKKQFATINEEVHKASYIITKLRNSLQS